MSVAEARAEIARIASEELPKVQTKPGQWISVGPGGMMARKIVPATPRDRALSRRLSKRIAELMAVIESEAA